MPASTQMIDGVNAVHASYHAGVNASRCLLVIYARLYSNVVFVCDLLSDDGIAHYMCPYCPKIDNEVECLLNHVILNHSECGKESFTVLRSFLCDKTGTSKYRRVQFGTTIENIVARKKNGEKIEIDMHTIQIRFKRQRTTHELQQQISDKIDNASNADCDTQDNTDCDLKETDFSKVAEIMPVVLAKLNSIGRVGDFVAILELLATGKLNPQNMALHLLLDVGKYLKTESVCEMRYSTHNIF